MPATANSENVAITNKKVTRTLIFLQEIAPEAQSTASANTGSSKVQTSVDENSIKNNSQNEAKYFGLR